MKLLALIAFGVLATVASGQGKTAAQKTAAPKTELLREGFILNPVVSKDFGCAEDYVKALNASGVEKRKMLADIVKYGCVSVLKGLYHVLPHEKKLVGASTSLINALLSFDLDTMERALIPLTVEQTPADDDPRSLTGWILESEYSRATNNEFVKSWRELHNKPPEKGH